MNANLDGVVDSCSGGDEGQIGRDGHMQIDHVRVSAAVRTRRSGGICEGSKSAQSDDDLHFDLTEDGEEGCSKMVDLPDQVLVLAR